MSDTSVPLADRSLDSGLRAETAEAPILAHAQRITATGGTSDADLDRIRATLRRRAGLTPGHLRTLAVDTTHSENAGHGDIELSLWYSPLSVRAYAEAGHPELVDLRRRGRTAPFTVERVLWWLADDREPTPAEAAARLEHLRRHGPGPEGFTLRSPVPAPWA